MTEVLTAAQMRAIEQAAIDSGEVTGLELMERAGRGVVEAVFEEWPELAEGAHRAVVLCGPGNNGGDGFVVARLLAARGWDVAVFLYGDVEKLPPDARVNYERWAELGKVGAFSEAPSHMSGADLLIDALFGTGLTRGLSDEFEDAWDAHLDCIAQGTPMVAVDISSGICADSGTAIGSFAFIPDIEVCFHRQKLGHRLGENGGKPIVKDIGLDGWQPHWRLSHDLVRLIELHEDGELPDLVKSEFDHKFSHGHALILSGGSVHGRGRICGQTRI